ncbi:MAG: lipid-A-disaccharide synthase [Xanthomonadaceae bacterium]|nr:lipid-A-disaccharide synthase [Xanthomonadaceae bacterium]
MATQVPDLQVVIPAATAECRAEIERLLAGMTTRPPNLRVLDGQARTAIVASDVVLLASGTATLEAMLAQRPMVVAYKLAPLTYRIVKALGLLRIATYALPNVLAGEQLVPELMQDACTPQSLADAVLAWFHNPAAVAALQPRFRAMHATLRRDASTQAAAAVAELLEASPSAQDSQSRS